MLAALLSGCVLNEEGGAATSRPAETTGSGLDTTVAPTEAPTGTTDGTTTATPSEVPDWTTCRGSAGTDDPVAVVRVHDAFAQPQGNMTIQAMHEWSAYDTKHTDASGCVTFAFTGPGEYQFGTAGGDCERQGTTTIEWDGMQDVNIDLSVDSVCNQA